MSKSLKVKVCKGQSFVKNEKGEFAKAGETLTLPHGVATSLISRDKVELVKAKETKDK